MLLMMGKKKTENPNTISYDEFFGMVTNKTADGEGILIEAKIKFSQGSELKEITGKSRQTRDTENGLVFVKTQTKENRKGIKEKSFQLKSTIPEEHETIIYSHPKIEREQENGFSYTSVLLIFLFLLNVSYFYFFLSRHFKAEGKD